jgi:hypothetical protein
MMASRMSIPMLAALAVAIGLVAPELAAADVITFSLYAGNTALTSAGFLGPYADVTVNRTSSTTATITFDADGSYRFGDGGSFAVNVNSTSFTSSATATTNGSAATTLDVPGHEDGFGIFNDVYNTFDGAGDSFTSGHFDLTDVGGTWASASDVLTGNAGGWLAGAHIFAGCEPTEGRLSCVATGFAAGNGDTPLPTPEPGSLLLVGTGLAGLTYLGRKRRSGGHKS